MHKKICLLIAFLLLCTSCSSNQQDKVKEAMESYPKSPAVTENQILYPKELGKDVLKTKIAIIDYTQCNDGYIYVHAITICTKMKQRHYLYKWEVVIISLRCCNIWNKTNMPS